MRILIVTQSYAPYFDKGAPAFMLPGLVTQLTLRRHNVTVLTATYSGPRPMSEVKPSAGEVVYLPSIASYRALTFNPGVFSFCRARLREFDVVQACGLYDLLGPAVARYCRRFSIPYVVEPMGMTRPIDRSLRAKRLWHALFARSYLRNAALFICTSELERREVVNAGYPPERIVVRPNGLDLEEFRSLPGQGTFRREAGIPADEQMVLFLSRLIPRKGADLLIDAFAEACPERGRLVIAGPEGEPGYLRFLQQRAAKRNLEKRVLFPGPLLAERKLAAMADCDIFVLPSRYENFANVIAEALACGKPVIVTDRCGISELVEGRAGLVIPYDGAALTAALRTLLTDRALYERLRGGCRGLAEQLDWNCILPEMESWLERVVRKNSPAVPVAH